MTLTAVPGIQVGHWTDSDALTGVTVVLLPEPNRATAEFRGAAPGSRESALLQPGMRIENIQAITLSGGSAYGLASADGVVRRLEAEGRGHRTIRDIIVPLVPAAIINDLAIGDPHRRPGPEEGAAAYDAATTEPVIMGNVGAGTGAVVAGWRGFSEVRKGGIGSASVHVGGAVVAALAVVNAVGDVFTLEGEPLTGGAMVPPLHPAPPPQAELANTVLVVVATDADVPRAELTRLNVRAHDAIGACIRPGHTRYDGDAAFAVSCGPVEAPLDVIGEAAFLVVGRAIEAAIRAATPAGGVRAMEDQR